MSERQTYSFINSLTSRTIHTVSAGTSECMNAAGCDHRNPDVMKMFQLKVSPGAGARARGTLAHKLIVQRLLDRDFLYYFGEVSDSFYRVLILSRVLRKLFLTARRFCRKKGCE